MRKEIKYNVYKCYEGKPKDLVYVVYAISEYEAINLYLQGFYNTNISDCMEKNCCYFNHKFWKYPGPCPCYTAIPDGVNIKVICDEIEKSRQIGSYSDLNDMKKMQQYRIYLCKDTYYNDGTMDKVSTTMKYKGTVIAESEYYAVKQYCKKNHVKEFERHVINEYETAIVEYIGERQMKKR